MIVVDIEVAESTDFKQLGPGYHRKDAAILCVGLYDGKDYVCCAPDDSRLADWLASDEDKIFHNSVYDTGWLVHGYGFKIGGTWHDTMTRAALIDEYADLDLDSCCKRMKVQGKNYDDTLDAWFETHKKMYSLKGNVWDNIDVVWMFPEGKVAMEKYNRQDCIATYNLFMAQEPLMGMHQEAYDLECKLQPVISLLNGNGFPLDAVARDRFTEVIRNKLRETEEILHYKYSVSQASDVVASPKKLSQVMLNLGIKSPIQTATGNQSWNAAALDEIDHPIIEHIQNVKKYNTLLNNFLEGSLVRGLVNDRIYSVFSPNKRDDGGTRTGRFGSRTVNLQQVPAREETADGVKTYGKEMRSLFIPEPGCMLAALDYSSIEYFGFINFSVGPKSDIARQQAFVNADFHTMAMELAGFEERIWAKRFNFTVIYGAGPRGIFLKNKKAFKTLENTQRMYNQFHAGLPYIKATMEHIQNTARAQGYIKSIGGRTLHKPKPFFDPATQRWNDGIYKMTNYLVQGSCADTLKMGLLLAYEAGLFDVLKLHATVHDENVVSVPYTKVGFEAVQELQNCMLSAYKDRWTVPIFSSCEVGDTWGYQNDDIWKEYKSGSFDFDKYRHLARAP
jgi:DNA polymerase I-like protein with 3'-5' exonuclease and polymerase domains